MIPSLLQQPCVTFRIAPSVHAEEEVARLLDYLFESFENKNIDAISTCFHHAALIETAYASVPVGIQEYQRLLTYALPAVKEMRMRDVRIRVARGTSATVYGTLCVLAHGGPARESFAAFYIERAVETGVWRIISTRLLARLGAHAR